MLEWSKSWDAQLSGTIKRAQIGEIHMDTRLIIKQKLHKLMTWINEKHQGMCPCCKKLELFKTPKKVTDETPSIHKIFPKEGYTARNIMIICTKCNVEISNSGGNDIRNLWLKIKTLELELA